MRTQVRGFGATLPAMTANAGGSLIALEFQGVPNAQGILASVAQLADAAADGTVTPQELLNILAGQLQGPEAGLIQSLADILSDGRIDRNDLPRALPLAFALMQLIRR